MNFEQPGSDGTFGIKLALQDFSDSLTLRWPDSTYYTEPGSYRIQGIRFAERAAELCPENLYIGRAEDFAGSPCAHFSVVSIGVLPDAYRSGAGSYLQLPSSCGLPEVLNAAAEVMDKYKRWDEAMQNALNQDGGVEALARIGMDFFGNPLFIHDPEFYIVACPEHDEQMTKWDYDERNSRYMVNCDTINNYKIDREYQSTLSTHGAHLFYGNQQGYRILYINIWNNARYEGRLCINELRTPILPSHFHAAEYFVSIIQNAYQRRNIHSGSYVRTFETFVQDVLDKRIHDRDLIASRIASRGWNSSDQYICMKLLLQHRDIDMRSAMVTCNEIERTIFGSCAFLYQENILILTNLTQAKVSRRECISKLSVVLREGLFKAGVSVPYMDFAQTADYYKQADIALSLGLAKKNMYWYFLFEDYALQFLFHAAENELPYYALCSSSLFLLKTYDAEHNTDLYRTLYCYLKNEQNAVVTARELYIHRSTLSYRLSRIRELAGEDLTDFSHRIYLMMSYAALQNQDENGQKGGLAGTAERKK